MKVGVVQMNSQEDKAANLAVATRLIEKIATEEGADLIVLPEYYAFLGGGPEAMQASAEVPPDGDACRTLSALAARLDVTIHAGSIVEKDGNRFYNTTIVFGPDGSQIARYRKMHLFDVDVPGGMRYRESDSVARGEEVVTYQVGDVTVGCSICYDLRFPELFRALRDKGAKVIVLPAAFTLQTGKDHWELLIRARAVETQTYFVASGQALAHSNGTKWCWGHSMVVDPWGHMIAQCSDGVGVTTAVLDFDRLEDIRLNLPVAEHHVLNA